MLFSPLRIIRSVNSEYEIFLHFEGLACHCALRRHSVEKGVKVKTEAPCYVVSKIEPNESKNVDPV